jgi:hypothetical protein
MPAPITLEQGILNLAQAVGLDIKALNTAISSEANTRLTSDNTLTASLTNEINTRVAQGAGLQAAITAAITTAASDATTKASSAQAASTPLAHAGSTGSAHGVVTSSVNGFMSSADKNKLDAIVSTSNMPTATILQTARTIAGVSFNGSANIDIPFANLTAKPTTAAGYGITDIGNTNADFVATYNTNKA